LRAEAGESCVNRVRRSTENSGMTRIWLGIGVLALSAAVVAQSAREQPSLGAVAKATQEQKAKAKSGGTAKTPSEENTGRTAEKKYTNEDLGGRPRPSSSSSYRTTSTTSSSSSGKAGGKDESYWRGCAERLRQRLQESSERLTVAKARLASMKTEGIDIALANGRSSPIAAERQRQAAHVQELETRARRDEQALKDLEQEGRRAGALPGWFR
jgi:hypothetical protein